MSAITKESDSLHVFENLYCSDETHPIVEPFLKKFDWLMRRSLFIHGLFVGFGVLEIAAFISGFAFFARSYALALLLAAIFFTFFSYFLYRLYEQTQRQPWFASLVDEYRASIYAHLDGDDEVSERHMAVATAFVRLANRLHAKEYAYYRPPRFFSSLAPALERFSCWYHWADILCMQEMLLQASVAEQIELVKTDPTSLEAHAHLANAYVMLSGLYIDPRKTEGYEGDRWIPAEKYTPAMQEKFRETAEKAIEEFKILCDYAPDDPWVHFQLAYSYHDLQMPLQEIREYETILSLTPEDSDVLFKLGVLYFEQGMNSLGLRIYEKLIQKDSKKGLALIANYGR